MMVVCTGRGDLSSQMDVLIARHTWRTPWGAPGMATMPTYADTLIVDGMPAQGNGDTYLMQKPANSAMRDFTAPKSLARIVFSPPMILQTQLRCNARFPVLTLGQSDLIRIR